MGQNQTYDSVRLIISMPPRHYFGGIDRQNALTVVELLRTIFPHIFFFDCDIYLSGSDREFAAHLKAAEAFQPHVGLALPNSSYALILNYRKSYCRNNLLLDFLRLPGRRQPLGNMFADELGIPIVMLWDHVITQAPKFLLGHPSVPRTESISGCLEKLRKGLEHKNFVQYVPISGHIDVFARLGVWKSTSVQSYVVPGQNVFLSGASHPGQELISDRILFAGNLNSSQVMSAYGNDQVVQEVAHYVTNVKCTEWQTAAWHAYEKIAAQKVAAGVAELHPDHSFFWSLGHDLVSNVVTTAFRTTIFKSVGTPIDFYGGFTDPDFIADCGRSGLFNAMGSVPFKNLGDIYARYQFSIDVTNSPFIHGSNAKVLNCFAAGGFMFVDWKDDLRRELGDIAEEFMYRNAEELRSKLEDLRRRPARRLEIMKIVRDRISEDLNFDTLLSRTIGRAARLSWSSARE